jgi:hypothetical protein
LLRGMENSPSFLSFFFFSTSVSFYKFSKKCPLSFSVLLPLSNFPLHCSPGAG